MALEGRETGRDGGCSASKKATDYNKAAVYLKQIIHSIECSGTILWSFLRMFSIIWFWVP